MSGEGSGDVGQEGGEIQGDEQALTRIFGRRSTPEADRSSSTAALDVRRPQLALHSLRGHGGYVETTEAAVNERVGAVPA